MRSKTRCFLLGLIVTTIIFGPVIADERIETFTFEDIHSIEIETISGSIRIIPGDESMFMVELINDLDEPELLDPEVEAKDGELYIEENFMGNNVRGETHWTIYLPPKVNLLSIECNSASGSMALEEFEAKFIQTESASGRITAKSIRAGELDLSTTSGRITLEDCEADLIKTNSASGRITAKSIRAEELDLSTASGKINVEDCKADFIKTSSASGKISVDSVGAKELVLSNASGKILVEDAEIDEEGEMSSASGDVNLYLLYLPSKRLEASSASADVFLKVPRFGKDFSMTLMKRADKGKIKCPFEYTEKETIRLHKNDRYLTDRYLVKRGKGGPEIKLSTASGTILIETNAKSK